LSGHIEEKKREREEKERDAPKLRNREKTIRERSGPVHPWTRVSLLAQPPPSRGWGGRSHKVPKRSRRAEEPGRHVYESMDWGNGTLRGPGRVRRARNGELANDATMRREVQKVRKEEKNLSTKLRGPQPLSGRSTPLRTNLEVRAANRWQTRGETWKNETAHREESDTSGEGGTTPKSRKLVPAGKVAQRIALKKAVRG